MRSSSVSPRVVEQAELDLGGMRRKEREIDAEPVPRRAERKRLAFADLGSPEKLRSLRK